MGKSQPRFNLPLPFILLLASSLGCIGITIGFLEIGYTIIFQNLYYIPIVLACFFYLRKGFLFSCILSLIYFSLMIIYTRDMNIALEAGIRVIIFVGVAGVVTYLSEVIRKSQDNLNRVSSFQEKIIENASVWVMAVDINGIVHLWNTAAELISGYQKEEVLGEKTIWKSMHPDPDIKKKVTQTVRNAIMSDEELKYFETPIQAKNGDQRIISWNIKELPEIEDEDKKYLAIGIDITEKVESRRELKKSRERWAEIFSKSLNPIALYQAVDDGADFVFTDINPALERVEKLPKEEVVGRKITEIFPGAREVGLLDILKRVYKTGNPEHPEPSFYKDDRIEGWRNNMIYQLSTGELVATYEDVTDRVRAEALIKEKHDYLESLISIANVPILTWNTSLEVTRINHACEALIGRPYEEVLGKTLMTFAPADHADRIMELLQSTVTGKRLENVEMDVAKKDGTIRSVLWSTATLFSRDEKPVAVIAQGRDITEEKRLSQENEAALAQIQKNMAQLAILNDEMRNPLTIIMGHVEMNMDEEQTQFIFEQIQRIDDIVTNLDIRWMKSEKVLNAMRKYYHLQVPGTEMREETSMKTG
ncbi:MAG TPA: PAS domain S-box protein [Methanospirillum sp.]|nr:PAS domain S-box protein [Methanospirillum sp.]